MVNLMISKINNKGGSQYYVLHYDYTMVFMAYWIPNLHKNLEKEAIIFLGNHIHSYFKCMCINNRCNFLCQNVIKI